MPRLSLVGCVLSQLLLLAPGAFAVSINGTLRVDVKQDKVSVVEGNSAIFDFVITNIAPVKVEILSVFEGDFTFIAYDKNDAPVKATIIDPQNCVGVLAIGGTCPFQMVVTTNDVVATEFKDRGLWIVGSRVRYKRVTNNPVEPENLEPGAALLDVLDPRFVPLPAPWGIGLAALPLVLVARRWLGISLT